MANELTKEMIEEWLDRQIEIQWQRYSNMRLYCNDDEDIKIEACYTCSPRELFLWTNNDKAFYRLLHVMQVPVCKFSIHSKELIKVSFMYKDCTVFVLLDRDIKEV